MLPYFAVLCEWWRYCKALCDLKCSQIEGNGGKFRHIEISNTVASSVKFSNSEYSTRTVYGHTAAFLLRLMLRLFKRHSLTRFTTHLSGTAFLTFGSQSHEIYNTFIWYSFPHFWTFGSQSHEIYNTFIWYSFPHFWFTGNLNFFISGIKMIYPQAIVWNC